MVAPPRRRRGRPPRPAEELRAERQEVLDACRRAINELGPDITTRELAEAAGVHKPTIYRHFGDKAGLAEALAEALIADLEAARSAAVRRGDVQNGLDELRHGLDAFTRLVVEETAVYRFLVRSIKATEGDVFELGLLEAFQRRIALRMASTLPGVDPEVINAISYSILGQAFAATEGWLPHRSISREELVDLLMTLVTGGIAAFGETPPADR